MAWLLRGAPRTACVLHVLLALTGCSASRRAPPPAVDLDSGAGDAPSLDASPVDAAPDVPPVCSGTADGGRDGAASHVSEAGACGITAAAQGDAGRCTADADCAGLGSGVGCLHGVCTRDACNDDHDCAPGSGCACQTGFVSGSYIGSNECLAAACLSDGDCPAGQYCVQSPGSYCGMGSAGRFCTTPADTCILPWDDCPCPPPGGWGNGFQGTGPVPACVYSQTVGHWICGSMMCNG